MKTRIVAGEVNEVYEMSLGSDKDVIVRVSHSSWNNFEDERWALEECRKVGLPVPRVLGIESVKDEGKTITVCIEEKIDGLPLSKILDESTMRSRERQQYFFQIGKALGKVHKVKTKGFGNLNKEGKGEYSTFKEYLMKRHRERKKLVEISKKSEVTAKEIDQALQLIKGNLKLLDRQDAILLHHDVGSEHYFFKDLKLVGVIDFENCAGGDPVMDFSWWDYFYGTKWPTTWVMDGYEDKSLFSEDFPLKLKLYKIYLGLTLLQYYWEEKNDAGLDLAGNRLQQDLREI